MFINNKLLFSGLLSIVATMFAGSTIVDAQRLPGQKPALDAFDAATSKLGDHTYRLAYKLTPGETLRYEVVHQAAVKTSVQGARQESHSRSSSGKSWKIKEVDADGNAVLTHIIDYIDMWSRTGGQNPIHYDSRSDDPPPPQYDNVAEMVNKPLSQITIDTSGKVLDRQDNVPQFDMGTGGITVPLPRTAVKQGAEWSTPGVVRVRDSEGRHKAIKTRQLYRLEKVATGVATISLRTEVLTPVDDPRIESQIVQRLSNGAIKFDIDAGVIRSRTLEWDEKVVGFNGPESNMAYVARLTETLEAAKVAKK